MPKRRDIKKILIIGSGPIVIGQACEFDYSGAQACKALRAEGYKVVLVNSNPATIMTDPEMADRTYIEPITADIVEKIIRKERPDSILPTLSGQTGLNTAVELAEKGVLKKYKVRMLGANLESIRRAEERDKFKQIIEEIGLEVPQSGFAHTWEEAGLTSTPRQRAPPQPPVAAPPASGIFRHWGGVVGHLEDRTTPQSPVLEAELHRRSKDPEPIDDAPTKVDR